MRVLILGSNGQLGGDVVARTPDDVEIIRHTRESWDITDTDSDYISEIGPDVIINCAGYVKVDNCEEEPEIAMAVNSVAVKNIAERASRIGAILMHVSTDYVFNGSREILEPYSEEDDPDPINMYGISKLAGELAVKSTIERHYIIRISSVFGKSEERGRTGNFVFSMIERGKKGGPVRVIDDIVMSPTYAGDAAESMWKILLEGNEFGIYHCNNGGQCSWFEFTKEIFRLYGIDVPVIPISRDEFISKAIRPSYSAMTTNRDLEQKQWKDGLKEFIDEIL